MNILEHKHNLVPSKPTNITFNDSINSYLPIYYHFLDGYISENIGYDTSRIQKFIKNVRHTLLPIGSNNINILFVSLDNNTFTINLRFYNLNDDSTNDIKINYDEIEKKLNDTEFINNLISLFNYCIYYNLSDNHATSILINNKNNNWYMMAFNSGDMIRLHDVKDNYFSPYYGVNLGPTTNIDGIKNILCAILLSKIYNDIHIGKEYLFLYYLIYLI